ncbi:right-handed parallel beta-helix repeat-containing protein [Candidatus Nitrotoga arctica]|uniref:Right handed beta helix region n=1 Tax=Candidatus Nitrotoga arctica TaxID=453162 RepID=A0ABM8YVT5_9PROT|nr:right-handed parallel beta-helix repeat-containing protein [Candidatus Nitrotoga arctica]CAG9931546.1 Right handed beta helix region [Candidatus Nitrotoga arctica]
MFKFSFQYAVMFIMIATSPLAAAQATRTWVSGVGDDVNPCSRTAPCKTFAGAISKTAAQGEISVLDPGGFGTVTITKAITIDGGGLMASILSSLTNGVIVNAGPSDVVTIRGIYINGANTGLNGIRFLAGKALHVENCVIENVVQKGIDAQTSTPTSALFVRDTVIRNAANVPNGGAMLIKPAAGAFITVSLNNVTMDSNQFGLRIEDRTKAAVRNTVAANSNPGNGFVAFSASAATEMSIENSSASNGATGITSNGGAAKVYISNVNVFNNAQGLAPISSGQIISFGNNKISGNAAEGSPTSIISQE